MSTIVLHLPLNILETVRDRGSVRVKSFFTELRIYNRTCLCAVDEFCALNTLCEAIYITLTACPACLSVILVDCVDPVGDAENAGLENTGPNLQGWKGQDKRVWNAK